MLSQEPASRIATDTSVADLPDEPCEISAPAEYRDGLRPWCEGGIFTKVNVSLNSRTFVGMLQLSKKGLVGFERRSSSIMSQLRKLTNKMVDQTRMDVAVTIHGPEGNMIGGCARELHQGPVKCSP